MDLVGTRWSVRDEMRNFARHCLAIVMVCLFALFATDISADAAFVFLPLLPRAAFFVYARAPIFAPLSLSRDAGVLVDLQELAGLGDWMQTENTVTKEEIMPKYLLIYHGGGIPERPEEGEKAMAAWGKWYEGMGSATVDPGAPVGQSHTVSKSGYAENGGANPASGYTIITAENYETACAHASKNPMVVDGSGSVEVAEMMEM